MNAVQELPLSLSGEEVVLLRGLLESEKGRLPAEIRHTDHREFRELLRQRLNAVERLLERFPVS